MLIHCMKFAFLVNFIDRINLNRLNYNISHSVLVGPRLCHRQKRDNYSFNLILKTNKLGNKKPKNALPASTYEQRVIENSICLLN